MSEWKTYKLSELVEIKYGKDHKHLADGEFPVYGSGGIMRYAETHLYDKESILIPRKGTLSNLFYLDKPFWSVDTMFYTKIKNGVHGKYLYYLLKSMDLASMNVGSAVPSLTTEVLNKVEISLPDLPTQRQIAQILSSLDDKIELNLQMNQTLEAMAQAIFKEWFVNFNFPNSLNYDSDDLPDGCDNKKSGKSSNQKNQGSDNGLPKGWRMGKLGEVLQPKKGKNITKTQAIEGDFPVVAGGLEPSCFHNESNTNEPVVTISSSGANAGFVRLYQTKVWSSDSCFIDNTVYPFVYYCYLFLKYNQKNIYDSQEGSAQPHIYPRHIMDLNTFIGNEKIVKYFDEIVKPIFEKIKYNSLQIQSLTQTRDTLLPKLMSGKICLNLDSFDVGDDFDEAEEKSGKSNNHKNHSPDYD
ncbi:restriction endonuclease subunit S [Eisenibacter elegans]|uniref:restriction endonuclease subunit S n=1 Tax=Eisenibacter elegans TaxID=997 RepID=UPI0003F66C2A|nr:restriction endonuclease subunit S [Eisenibacter elegans]